MSRRIRAALAALALAPALVAGFVLAAPGPAGANGPCPIDCWEVQPTGGPILHDQMTYPGVNAEFGGGTVDHHWTLKTDGNDADGLVDLAPVTGGGYVPCTFNGTWMTAADHCVEYNANVDAAGYPLINPMADDLLICGTIKTTDGHYNWLQFGTSRAAIPWGFLKLSTYAFVVSGDAAKGEVKSGITTSDGIKHYVCGQRVGDVFSIIIDGVTKGSATIPVGNINFDPATGLHGFQVGGKYGPGQPLNVADMLNGTTWNVQYVQIGVNG